MNQHVHASDITRLQRGRHDAAHRLRDHVERGPCLILLLLFRDALNLIGREVHDQLRVHRHLQILLREGSSKLCDLLMCVVLTTYITSEHGGEQYCSCFNEQQWYNAVR